MTAAPIGWAAEALIASGLLMAAVLVLRRPVRAAFGPRVAYALWALPAIRLVLPPVSAALPTARATPVTAAGRALVIVFADAASAVEPAFPWPTLVAALWLAGTAAFLAYHVRRYRRFCRSIEAGAVEAHTVGDVRVVTSGAAAAPLAFGLRRRVVALPVDFAERYDADERGLALAHEIGHHRRRDLHANWAALAVLACHWPNPLAWIAYRAFRADQELANDACVLADRSAAERHTYARAIVKAAGAGGVAATCHLHTIANLKGRLHMLKWSPASRRRIASGGASVAAIALAGLVLTASGSGAAAIAATAQVAEPAPPVPPAPPVAAVPGQRVDRIVVTKDGHTTEFNGTTADIDAHVAAGDRIAIRPAVPGGKRIIVKMPSDPGSLVEIQDIPAVAAAKCGIGSGEPAVMTSGTTRPRKIVVCTDRIDAMVVNARQSAIGGQAIAIDARTNATASLVAARAAIVADRNLTEAQRREALAGIDQAQTELASQRD